jgi:hypothetical protein
MPWLVTGHVSLCSEEFYHQAYRRMKLSLFTFLTHVCTFFLSYHLDSVKFEITEHLVYPEPDPDAVNPSEKTTELVGKSSASSLLAQAAEEKKRAGLELRDLQAKLDEFLLSREQAEANAAEEKRRAGLEQREVQAKL